MDASRHLKQKVEERRGQPDAGFWEQTLEMAVDALIERAGSDAYMDGWIADRTAQQAAMLRHLLGLPPEGSAKARKAGLQDFKPELRCFVPVHEFAAYKHRAAVLDFARRRLPPEVIDLAAIGEDKHDAAALIDALYHRDWSDLALLFQIDKIHKSGFARMVLPAPPRRGPQPFADFVLGPAIPRLLADYDGMDTEGRVSEFRGALSDDASTLVFIRRPERPDRIIKGTTILHGFAPEWIILDFHEAAVRVNIASKSGAASLEIANAIASAYYDAACEYENDRATSHGRQIQRLLDALVADGAEGLGLVEVSVEHSPLMAAPKLVISSHGALPVGEAVRQVEAAFGPLLADLDRVKSIKVLYKKKRISLIFERPEDSFPTEAVYVVRYTDHRLSAGERRLFETFMLATHGLTVVSTEKRFKPGA